jgi:hypothetical protein
MWARRLIEKIECGIGDDGTPRLPRGRTVPGAVGAGPARGANIVNERRSNENPVSAIWRENRRTVQDKAWPSRRTATLRGCARRYDNDAAAQRHFVGRQRRIADRQSHFVG